jgi:hypothetical protein
LIPTRAQSFFSFAALVKSACDQTTNEGEEQNETQDDDLFESLVLCAPVRTKSPK